MKQQECTHENFAGVGNTLLTVQSLTVWVSLSFVIYKLIIFCIKQQTRNYKNPLEEV